MGWCGTERGWVGLGWVGWRGWGGGGGADQRVTTGGVVVGGCVGVGVWWWWWWWCGPGADAMSLCAGP